MTETYEDLLAKRESLNADMKAVELDIKKAERAARAQAIQQAQALLLPFGLGFNAEALKPVATRTNNTKGMPVEPKWRHEPSGATWAGRGKAPAWFDENSPDVTKLRD